MEDNRTRDARIALGHLVEFCQRGVAVDPIGPHKVLAGFIKDVESEGQALPAGVGMAWDLVEQTSSRLTDSMDEACRETSMALRPGLLEKLEFAIAEAEHKPGEWVPSYQGTGGICSSIPASSISMTAFPWQGEPWAKFSSGRDACLALFAVNALPELIERVRGAELSERAADRKAEELQAEVDRLRARLEVLPNGGPDGIACRDETIRGQDEAIDRLRAENKDLKRAVGAAQLAELFSDIKTQETAAARDVLAERRRQVEGEGRQPGGDDAYANGELASAGAAYAIAAYEMADGESSAKKSAYWPWSAQWWKPSTPRRNLIKAGALILAEIERLDRAEAKAEARIDAIGQNGNDGEHYDPAVSLGHVLRAAAPSEIAEAMYADGWSPHAGGACPVRVGTRIEVEYRNGDRSFTDAQLIGWQHYQQEDDIVAYRLAGS